jgi:hypothetical protein
MDELTRAFKDLSAMIASERDARQASARRVLGSVDGIRRELDELRTEIVESDARTSGFESAMLEAVRQVHDAHLSLERRVADLEQWRREQAS